MSRINVEDALFADPRFHALEIILGDREKAIGKLVLAWRMAQHFWLSGQKNIPEDLWDKSNFGQLCQVGLAEKKDDGFYVKGSSEKFEWLLKCKAAGQKSAAIRKENKGTAVPDNAYNLNSKTSKKPKVRSNLVGTKTEGRLAETEAPTPTPTPTLNTNTNTLPQKKSTTSKKQNIGTVDVIARYCELFEQRYGAKAVISGVEAGQLGRLTKSHGKDQAIKIIESYFKLPDQWIISQCHPVAMIERQINKILVNMAKKEPERRWLEIPTGENK